MLRAFTKRRLATAAAGGVLVVLLAAGGAAARTAFAPPPPAATPEPAAGAAGKPAQPSFVPPGAGRPGFFVQRNFAGRTLHWVQRGYSFNPGTPDPANGKEVSTEVWVRVGTDGLPTDLHVLYTFADGSFQQEIVQDRNQETVVFNPVNAPTPGPSCRAVWPSSLESLRYALPPFVEESALGGAGFARAGTTSLQLPATASLPGVKPVAVHVAGAMNGWEKKTVADGVTATARFDVGADGRVLATREWRTDNAGVVLGEARTTYGTLEEYDATAVPTTVFALSAQAGGVCRA